VLIEAMYEEEHDPSAELIRRQAWCAMLCGAGGQFFGNNPTWHFDGPGLYPSKMTWPQSLDSQGARDMTILRGFFSGLPWHRLVPEANHLIVTNGYGKDHIPAMTAHIPDRRLCITYVPSTQREGQGLVVDLAGFPGPVAAKWLDPATGKPVVVEGAPFANSGSHAFRPPDDPGDAAHDWVLVLTVKEPGT
jgi:hypothetical protein